MTSSSVKNNFVPPGLVSNLQQVLLSRKGGEDEQSKSENEPANGTSSAEPSSDVVESNPGRGSSKPVVLLTNSDGIESPGLTSLVDALVREGLYDIHVCAPQSDKSVSGHSMTFGETVAVSSAEINGANAYEVSGTPVDCVSLALSGALFALSKPLLVICGVNKGSSCGQNMFYSGVVGGAREALISGLPSLSVSLNWKKDESQESDFRDAVSVCMPLVTAFIRDVEKGVFPKCLSLNIEVPTSPLTNKGFKITQQSLWRCRLGWQAISATRNLSAGRFMSNQQSLGIQLAQLSRDASAAGAARRLGTQKKSLEVVESVGASGQSDSDRKVKYFRLELLETTQENMDEDLDIRAVEDGFVAVTPLPLSSCTESKAQVAASKWMSAALQADQ